ncbi:MAG: O-methyltransferase [Limisphaerales bacterium]
MSAGSIPYHLRPNKAVDRLLFLELCTKLALALQIEAESYSYVGFGGPQMEDFRLLHEKFPQMPMLCIECSENVIPRQVFNCPHTQVRFLPEAKRSGEWVKEWVPDKPVIIWFDYALKAERSEQFNEFQTLLACAPSKSVLRVTMNADLPLGSHKTTEQQMQSIQDNFGKIVPPDISDDDMAAGQFPSVISRMFQLASEAVLQPAGERVFQPLLITSYRDTHQMLVVTGLLAPKADCDAVISASGLNVWPYFPQNWTDVRFINMPELTLKERIHINQLLPREAGNAQQIQNTLGFQVDELPDISLDKIRNYTEFYRHFPQFGRIAI